MQKKTRKELEAQAVEVGLRLDYVPEVVIDDIFEIGEEEWIKSMQKGIGSSSAYAACGKDSYKPLPLFITEKITGKSTFKSDLATQYSLDSGHMQETALAKWYANQIGYVAALQDPRNPSTSEIKDILDITQDEWNKWNGKGVVCVSRCRYAHPDYPFMYTDLDGIAVTPAGKKYILEFKTTKESDDDYKWNWHSGVFGRDPDCKGKVGRPGYIYQARHHMAVMNVDRCDIIISNGFNANNIKVITVYRDMEEEKELITSESRTWNMIQKGIVPEITSISEEDRDKISKCIRPEEIDEIPVTLPQSLKGVIDEYYQLNDEIENAKNSIKANENRQNAILLEIEQNLKGHKSGIFPKYETTDYTYDVVFEYKASSREYFDGKKLKTEMPEIYDQYSSIRVGDEKPLLKKKKEVK